MNSSAGYLLFGSTGRTLVKCGHHFVDEHFQRAFLCSLTEAETRTVGELIDTDVLILFEFGNNLIGRAENQVFHQFIPIEFFATAKISKVDFLWKTIVNVP